MESGYDDRDGKIWLDGRLIDWREANVHVLTHAMHYASSCLLYTSPSPRDRTRSRMPSSA